MEHTITGVEKDSIAYELGIKAGDRLISINGEEIIDEIDYQALESEEKLEIGTKRGQKERHYSLEKDAEEPLGMYFEGSMACNPRACKNKCAFCFIDQMPPGMRESLYVKDDDWRLSLMMGNFITLTNVDDREMERIIKRKASPLYISVHTTDMALRKRMMKNPDSEKLLERLTQLKEAGIAFHAQLVLCPEINDGENLKKTMNDLLSFRPAFQTAAMVPVGLTKYREGLTPLRVFTKAEAEAVIDAAEEMRKKCLSEDGERRFFPSDEFYCIAGRDFPQDEEYEKYAQIENGVGLMRLFIDSVKNARAELGEGGEDTRRRILIPTGKSAAPILQKLADEYSAKNITVKTLPIENTFFGHEITVTGLITGRDLIEQTKNESCDEMAYCDVMLRSQGDIFLDGLSPADVSAALPFPARPIAGDGETFYRLINGLL
ncbi:MAG: DUF512 domain-containing protein [Eubacteriales bacterium]|nr:DUF512 domain-containing protein [Eubacteriales bacterium]MDD3880642.1 DUF512 domain-containing protein [Eubacteriales bacterium]MDD4513548.1 DUF512 domain-containing protein [Eubacteriales bacterium]